MMRLLMTVILISPAIVSAQLIPSDVMEFGAYSSHWANNTSFYTSGRLDSMREELGLNSFMSGGFDSVRVNDFYTDGIFPYPWFVSMDEDEEPQVKYAHTTYFVTHPEPDSNQYYATKFINNGYGWQVSRNDTAWFAYDGSGVMLGNLRLKSPNRWSWFDQPHLEYYPVLGIAISPSADDSDAVAGIFEAYNLEYAQDPVRFVDTIYVRDLPRGGQDFEPVTLSLVNDWESSETFGDPYFWVRNSADDNTTGNIRFQFETAGACTVYVDYFTLYDQNGKELVVDGLQDDAIKQSTGRESYKDKILGWWLKDTMRPANFRPYAYISSLIKDTTDAVWTYPVEGAGWLYAGTYNPSPAWSDTFREFLRICNPDVLRAYFYPIDGDADYTGWDNNGNVSEKLQSRLAYYLTVPCDSVRAALAGHDSTSWLYTPQYWWCLSDSGCMSNEQRRKPTESELQCITYLGMCYHPKSIIFWKYDSSPYSGDSSVATQGLVDENGNPRPEMYGVVKNHINPYIKAIDLTYLGLTWVRAYHIKPDSAMPAGWLDTVYAVSNTSDPNPDLGWFHVGQFSEGSANYMMLVNRACSQGESDPTPAPSITATLKFDATNLGLGNFVYIIDIADSIFFTAYEPDSVWEDTTYSAIMPDGAIPFTTVLGPGEGRLFKIVGTEQQ